MIPTEKGDRQKKRNHRHDDCVTVHCTEVQKRAEENILAEERRKDWRKLHKEEFHSLYSSSDVNNKSKRMRWAANIARMGEKRNACGNLVGKHKGKGPLGIPRLGGRMILKRIRMKWFTLD